MTNSDEQILYKVVHKQTRFGSNWAIFSKNTKKTNDQHYQDGVKFRKKYPQLFPRYLKGAIIEAPIESLGLMMFGQLRHCTKFRAINRITPHTKVVRVQPLEEVRLYEEGSHILRHCGSTIFRLELIFTENEYPKADTIPIGEGIFLCHKIQVLE